jgi:hypothetical protein
VLSLTLKEEDESGDDRWLKRRLPSIMAAIKVAKMTPKGMWVSVPWNSVDARAIAEEAEKESVGAERLWVDSMAADQ